MNSRFSPYTHPWIWLTREISVIALFVLAAWAVIATGPAAVPQMLALAGCVAVSVVLTLRMVADILVAGFCQWSKAMGYGLGALVASIRYARRRR